MNSAGVLAVAANQDHSGGRFLLLRPVIMRGGLACGHRVSPHGRTMNFDVDDVLNTEKVGPVDNFCVSDKVMPAYPEDHTLGTPDADYFQQIRLFLVLPFCNFGP